MGKIKEVATQIRGVSYKPDDLHDTYIITEFGYDLSRTCDEIRPTYHHVETCQQTVPEAITAFLEGESFEDVIRTAVSLGGDCDTLTCIAGGIAEAFYGIPVSIAEECRKRLSNDMLAVLERFKEMQMKEILADGSLLKTAIGICGRNGTQQDFINVLQTLRDSWVWVPCNAVLSDRDYEAWSKVVLEAGEKGELDSIVGQELTNQDNIRFIPDILQSGDDYFFPIFTSDEEMGEYGEHFSKLQKHFLEAANLARNNEKNVRGVVINAFSDAFIVPKGLFNVIAEMGSIVETKEEESNA